MIVVAFFSPLVVYMTIELKGLSVCLDPDSDGELPESIPAFHRTKPLAADRPAGA